MLQNIAYNFFFCEFAKDNNVKTETFLHCEMVKPSLELLFQMLFFRTPANTNIC